MLQQRMTNLITQELSDEWIKNIIDNNKTETSAEPVLDI